MSESVIYLYRDDKVGNIMNRRTRAGNQNPMFGKHHTEEAKAKMREKALGRYVGSKSPRFGKIGAMRGKHHTEEAKAKIREANIGSKNPMFGRVGKANPMFGVPSPMLGKHHSEEAKEKIRKTHLGKKFSEETKAKISRAKKGIPTKPCSEEKKAKIGQANRGERNGMWKGDKATKEAGRFRAQRRYKHPENYEIHHIDGNPLNNSPENIALVTRREHMMMDGRLHHRNEEGKFIGETSN